MIHFDPVNGTSVDWEPSAFSWKTMSRMGIIVRICESKSQGKLALYRSTYQTVCSFEILTLIEAITR